MVFLGSVEKLIRIRHTNRTGLVTYTISDHCNTKLACMARAMIQVTGCLSAYNKRCEFLKTLGLPTTISYGLGFSDANEFSLLFDINSRGANGSPSELVKETRSLRVPVRIVIGLL